MRPAGTAGCRRYDLVGVQTVAVLRKRWLVGTITEQRFTDAVGDLEDLEFDRYLSLQFMRRAAWSLGAVR